MYKIGQQIYHSVWGMVGTVTGPNSAVLKDQFAEVRLTSFENTMPANIKGVVSISRGKRNKEARQAAMERARVRYEAGHRVTTLKLVA